MILCNVINNENGFVIVVKLDSGNPILYIMVFNNLTNFRNYISFNLFFSKFIFIKC